MRQIMAALTPYAVIPNPEYYLHGISDDEQIVIVSDFWKGVDGFREVWDLKQTTYVLSRDGGAEHAYVAVGSAAKIGLNALLVSRNLLPYGPNARDARMITHCFDSLPSESNDIFTTVWLEQKQMVIRYYYHVYDKVPINNIANGLIIGAASNNRVMAHYKTVKNQLVALLIVKCAYGWHFTVPSRRQVDLKELSQWINYKGVFFKFVIPMIHFVVTEMNPHRHLSVRKILDTNLSRLEEKMRERARNNGVWSHELLRVRLGLHTKDPGYPNEWDNHVTKGVEYHFARLSSLIIPNYKLPYNEETQEQEKVYLTLEEYNRLYVGYDDTAVARFGVPEYP